MDAAAWDERYAATPLLWGAEANRWLIAEAADLPPGRALDLAAGEGRNAVWLAARGWTVTAVDFSATALDKGRRRAEALDVAVEWVQADLLAWTPPPRAFDLVVVAYLQLPPAQRRRVHRAAAGAVAEGGTLLVVAHDITNLTDGVGGPSDPTVLFGPEDVVADLAEAAHLHVERAERVRRPVATETGPAEAIDVLVRATGADRDFAPRHRPVP